MNKTNEINKLTVRETVERPLRYSAIKEGLMLLPCPESIKIGRGAYRIPATLREMSQGLTWGQRVTLSEMPEGDGDILMAIFGALYGADTKDILSMKAKDAYPAASHIIKLLNELLEREGKLLYRKPSSDEISAGIERLSKYGQLQTLIFLQQSFNETVEGVMEHKYEDCLTRLMLNREQQEYQERYSNMLKERNKRKK